MSGHLYGVQISAKAYKHLSGSMPTHPVNQLSLACVWFGDNL